MVERLKLIDCCWYCKDNVKCGMATYNKTPVCQLDRPTLEECQECILYKADAPCAGFKAKC